jgi:hypothetical protein
MTQDSVLTTNSNLLQTTKFRLVFNRIPNVEYFLTEVNLPGVSLPRNVQPTPFRDRPVPGDKLDWEELRLVFNVDENLKNWQELYNWIRGLGKPTNFGEYSKIKKESNVYSDAVLMPLSSHNNVTYKIHFKDAWPQNLSGIRWTTQGSANEPIISEAVFQYLYYDIETVG